MTFSGAFCINAPEAGGQVKKVADKTPAGNVIKMLQKQAEEIKDQATDLIDVAAGKDGFGRAVITFVRNNTLYPMSVGFKREKKGLVDKIPKRSIVRIKSLKADYGEQGKYFSVRQIGDYRVLKADAEDPTSAPTDLLVKKYKNVSTKQEFLGLALPDEPDVMLVASKNNLIQLGPSKGGFDKDGGADAHWMIEGARLETCFLKNRFTGGMLGPLGGQVDSSQEFPPKDEQISWKGSTGQSGKVSIADLESGLSEKEGLSISSLVWRANKARQHLLESKLSDEKFKAVFYAYLEQAQKARSKFSSRQNPEPIRYGDKIKLSHTNSMQGLCVGSAAHPGGGSGSTEVFCSNADSSDQISDELSCWWIIKGQHHSTDRLNCRLATPVKAGDVIRLENAKTGQNLSAEKLSKSFEVAFEKDKVPDDFSQLEVFADGREGIGSINDNWVITPIEGSGNNIWKGREFMLTHGMTRHKMHSFDSFFQTQSMSGHAQKVVALERKEEEKTEAPTSNAEGLLDKSELSGAVSVASKVGQQSQEGEAGSGSTGVSAENMAALKKSQKQAASIAKTESKKHVAAPAPAFIDKTLGWFVSSAVHAQSPKNDVAWTGFQDGAVFEDDPDQRIAIEIVKLGMDSTIAPGETLARKIQLISDRPSLTGFASQKIEGIGRDTLISLPPMLGKGVAWINQPVTTPGSFSVTFLGRTVENGRLEVVLGQDVDLEWLYKVVIGSGGGRKTSIIKREVKDGKPVETEVFSIDKSENHSAGIQSGQFTPYWVSFDKGSISQGYGLTPGQKIVSSWRDQNAPKQPYRIGFGSFREQSDYTGIDFGQAVTVDPPEKTFASFDQTFDLSGGQEQWLDKPLRVPGTGTISFWAEGQGDVILMLSESDSPGSQQYAVKINSAKAKMEVLEWRPGQGKYEKTLDTGSQDDFRINSGRRHVWVSFDNEQIFLGSGEKFQRLKLTRPKNKEVSNFLRVGFMGKGQGAKVGGVKISSPVRLIQVEPEGEKEESWKGLLEKDSAFVISPFDYSLEQSGPSIRFKDEVSGSSQFLGKASTKGATYEFITAIGKDGHPKITWTREPENPAQLRLKVLGKALRGAGQSIFLASSYMESTGQQEMDDFSDGKMDVGSAVAAAASTLTTGLGLGVSRLGIELEAMSKFHDKSLVSEKDESMGPKPMLKHKQHAAYAHQDKESQKNKAGAMVPPEAEKNRKRLEQELSMGQKWVASDPKKLVRLLALYKKVIGLITHPYVVEKGTTRATVVENLESLYQAHEEFFGMAETIDPSFGVMLDLLLTAYSNPYLIDSTNPEGEQLRQTLVSRVSTLAGKMLTLDGWLDLPALSNMPLWLEQGLPEPGKGIVEFSAKGQGDLMVSLTQDVVDVRSDVEGYKIFFGGRDNTQIQIRVRGFVKPVVSAEVDDVLNQIVNKKFWVKIDGGKISVGKDEPTSENKLLEWTDPYPPGGIEYISISTKQMPATIEGLSVKPLEES